MCMVGFVFFVPGIDIIHTLLVLSKGAPQLIRALAPSSHIKGLGSRSLV